MPKSLHLGQNANILSSFLLEFNISLSLRFNFSNTFKKINSLRKVIKIICYMKYFVKLTLCNTIPKWFYFKRGLNMAQACLILLVQREGPTIPSIGRAKGNSAFAIYVLHCGSKNIPKIPTFTITLLCI